MEKLMICIVLMEILLKIAYIQINYNPISQGSPF
jgi:hypothetical protein